MLNQQSTSAYQTAAASGATQAGLLQIVYSHLAKDLLHAAEAVRQADIEARCASSTHALLLLGHLDSWAGELEEVRLVTSLREFYDMLRTSILQLQAAPEATRFDALAQMVFDMRAVWQAKEASVLSNTGDREELRTTEPGALSFHA